MHALECLEFHFPLSLLIHVLGYYRDSVGRYAGRFDFESLNFLLETLELWCLNHLGLLIQLLQGGFQFRDLGLGAGDPLRVPVVQILLAGGASAPLYRGGSVFPHPFQQFLFPHLQCSQAVFELI
jgi:hypothetical protein